MARIKVIQSACDTLTLLRDRGALTLDEIAAQLGESRGTVRNWLDTLGAAGFVRCDGGFYSPGATLLAYTVDYHNTLLRSLRAQTRPTTVEDAMQDPRFRKIAKDIFESLAEDMPRYLELLRAEKQ